MASILVLAPLLLLPLLLLLIIRSIPSRNSELPPSPPKLPFIGNLHQLGPLLHQSLSTLSRKHGPLMYLQLGQVPTFVVSSPELAKEMMKTYDHIFANRPTLKVADILVYGSKDIVFAPYGEHWKVMRKLCVNQLLSSKMVQSFQNIREEEVASMLSKISGEVNMSEIMNLFTNNVLFKAISGTYFREEGRSDAICKLIMDNTALLGEFCVSDFLPSLGWLDKVFGLEKRARNVLKGWDDAFDEIIQDHAKRSKQLVEEQEKDADFLSVLLALEKDDSLEIPLDREVIKGILQDMIAAGTETSFIVLDWGMAELIRNPEAMKRLQNEVRGIAQTKSMVKYEDLSKMSYLKAVLKEVLRLHPPVPLLIPRESMEHCKIQDYKVSKKARVIINAWAIGRDPTIWEDPEQFRPERFLGSSVDFRGHDFAFIPFGAGRRICPGMQFAVSTLELAFANLIHKFDWRLPDSLKREDMDMGEAPGLTTRRIQSLRLVAEPSLIFKDCT